MQKQEYFKFKAYVREKRLDLAHLKLEKYEQIIQDMEYIEKISFQDFTCKKFKANAYENLLMYCPISQPSNLSELYSNYILTCQALDTKALALDISNKSIQNLFTTVNSDIASENKYISEFIYKYVFNKTT